MSNPLKSFSTTTTPQSQPIPGSAMVKNNAGGYTFALDQWQRLNRFLIIGVDGGTYYVNEHKHTLDNAKVVLECLASDYKRTIDAAVDVSERGLAKSNDQAIFVLALGLSQGSTEARRYASSAVPKVCRIATHLFSLMTMMGQHRGKGRLYRDTVANWYTSKEADQLAYQVVKYRSRDGWDHRKASLLSHWKAPTPEHQEVLNFIFGTGEYEVRNLVGFDRTIKAKTAAEAISLIEEYRLPWETLPTELLNEPKVWEALLANNALPMGALLRNLARLTNIGMLKPLSGGIEAVIRRFDDVEEVRKARLHPIAILEAMAVYQAGRGFKGNLTWTPVPQVIDALEAAFYHSFEAIVPAGKRTLLGIDVSGSMARTVNGGVLSARDSAAALAMATFRTEPQAYAMGFTGGFVPLNITAKSTLPQVMDVTRNLGFDRTDCAIPMLWALANKIEVDTFVTLTDNETWFGSVHPVQALQQYQDKMGIPARNVVVGMISTGFSIADPNRGDSLDVVGMSADTPSAISAFSRGDF